MIYGSATRTEIVREYNISPAVILKNYRKIIESISVYEYGAIKKS